MYTLSNFGEGRGEVFCTIQFQADIGYHHSLSKLYIRNNFNILDALITFED